MTGLGRISRRGLLGGITAAAAVPLLAADTAPGSLWAPGARLVLLGTGAGPVPMAGRTGICTALIVDGRVYLIDVGHGAFDQFEKAGLAADRLDAVFVTHLHSDHIADLYTLLWLRFGGYHPLTHPVHVYGPGRAGALPPPSSGRPVGTLHPALPTPGIRDFIDLSMQATAYDINLRLRDEAWPDIRDLVRVHEIMLPPVGAGPTGDLAPPMQPFEVMSDEHVRVTAILVRHPPVFPSYALRFDTTHGSVVFSGDTTVTDNIVTLARGSDILVHEAIDLWAVETFGNLSTEQIQHHRHSHADVTKLGPLAQRAGVRALVLSHLAPSTGLLPDAVWRAKAQRGLNGDVIVGTDLARVELTRR